jgi:hypothetical protein
MLSGDFMMLGNRHCALATPLDFFAVAIRHFGSDTPNAPQYA